MDMQRVGMFNKLRHIFLAFTNPIVGNEAAFNTWYDTCHVPEVLRYGRGFTGCRRFRFSREVLKGSLVPWEYLALYDLECDDLKDIQTTPWAQPNPPITPFRGLLDPDHVGWVYSPQSGEDSNIAARNEVLAITLEWGTGREALESLGGSELHQSRRVYHLADAQRHGQRPSPWPILLVSPAQPADASLSLTKADAVWSFDAVSDYVLRTDNMISADKSS
jgi:hypothetical protein